MNGPGGAHATRPGEVAGFPEWTARALFGLLLALIAISATLAGGFYFASLIMILAAAAVREWHRMVSGHKYALEIFATAGAIMGSLASVVILRHGMAPGWFLLFGGILAGLAARIYGASVFWNSLGVVYIGVPSLSLVLLRSEAANGAAAVMVVFIAVWSADTGALVLGRFLGGPKLAPSLSPNKTWAGFLGGSAIAALALGGFASLWGGDGWKAALLGLVLALAGHSGDLFESWVKRRVGLKNSGGLIPGHGGVLDRVDSVLFAAPLAAALVFVFGLDPLFGGHW